MNSIDERLSKLNKKIEAKIAKRLERKQSQTKKQPNEANYLTSSQIREARNKFGSGIYCLICFKKETMNKAHAVDHCHVTGKIRGILCYKCNIGLGYFNEDIELLNSALKYLVQHKLNPDELTNNELKRLRLIQNR